jgi:hypothetical protein
MGPASATLRVSRLVALGGRCTEAKS